ncbi:class III extradiol dioxygenase subunit B-like domain-containing protein [Streptomyces flavofungini]|uniref:class III extradiol dioxygenase subunit B-like domain-containing protein n=1 Tax=Streptomyces flavofungini TaxID=68200 RepID=UPI0025B2740C|nr:class III extradiol dioxygenase subunit B-like domain-containing protein [Streptomyces flavofungini]WJV45751.1 class III extradiol dioxygenase subunit B-like domain-containing protein [Streptomyces flavofungini]
MLVAAAVCPCPPLLVPEVAAGAAPELDPARAACADAVGVLAASRPDRLVVVGPAEQPDHGPHPQGTRGSFRGFGVDLDVRLGETPVDDGARAGGTGDTDAGPATGRRLPVSLAVAGWLLARTEWSAAPLEGLGVGEPLAPERCIHMGGEIGGSADRVALLVMGDASACRTLKAPGYLDERAAGFDADVARALAAADVAALKALDAELAQELKAAGRAPWQVLAGAAEGAGLCGELLFDDAPYGVGYLVAAWS